MTLSSSAFKDGEMLPARYTVDGESVSPPLQWTDPPAGAESFVLICDDPDAPSGTFTHWIVYNIPAGRRALAERMPAQAVLNDGTRQGVGDYRRVGYGPPAPPSGTHRYIFTLYALDLLLPAVPNQSVRALRKAMEGHVLAEAKLTGKYKRK